MSNPANRLSAFRSYSYYHVLVMCDSSNTADLLAKSQNPSTWEHATPFTTAPDNTPGSRGLGKYAPKCVYDPADPNKCAGRYIVLIDGSTDAAFAITQARWTSSTAALAVPGDGSASLALEGSINISEPKGVAFLDQVVKCSIALGVDSAQTVFCLKTFFVGYTFDSETGDKPEHITDVPPVNFIAYDVKGTFTEQGGNYEMMFVALANGASRLPQYSKAVNAMSITAGESLKLTMDALQNNIRRSYDEYFTCIEKQLRSVSTPAATALADSLCRVEYVIEVDDHYTDPKYVVNSQLPQYKNTAGCADKSQITFPANTSIETAISTIMSMCPEVQKEMTAGNQTEKVKYEYKIHTCVQSTPMTGSDVNAGKMKYTVYYRVKQFMSPKTVVYDPDFQLLQADDAEVQITQTNNPKYDKIRRNLIEFDYLYTGKNIDILEFELALNMGLAYLQTATLANTFKGQLERAAAVVTAPSSADTTMRSLGGKYGESNPVQTPVFFGKQITTPSYLNALNVPATVQSAYTISKHASLEVSEAKVKIVGNDRLLHSTNLTSSPEYMRNQTSQTQPTQSPADEANFRDWTKTPAYVRIKIKMPRDNDDFSLFTGASTADQDAATAYADYSRDFWFDGYYYVCGIDHVFDNGEFTQTLDMLGLPKIGTLKDIQSNAENKETNFESSVDQCFNNVVGCGKTNQAQRTDTTSGDVVVAITPPANQPYTSADAKNINEAATDIEKVKGWKDASPEVQQAIKNAAKQYGVDEVVLAQMCYQESKFDPNAKAGIVKKTGKRASTATGLFQFLEGTWDTNGVGTDTKLTPAILADKSKRLDPQLNAYAGAKYLKQNAKTIGSSSAGDLYLAHFAGPGGASSVIKLDNQTNGQATIVDAWGLAHATKVVNANKGYISLDMTVRELRAWSENKMANTLIEPVRIAKSGSSPLLKAELAKLKDDPVVTVAALNERATAREKIAVQQSCTTQDTATSTEAAKQPCASAPNKDKPAPSADDSSAKQVTPRKARGATKK